MNDDRQLVALDDVHALSCNSVQPKPRSLVQDVHATKASETNFLHFRILHPLPSCLLLRSRSPRAHYVLEGIGVLPWPPRIL